MFSILVNWVEFTQILLKTVCTSISNNKLYYYPDMMLDVMDQSSKSLSDETTLVLSNTRELDRVPSTE